MNDAVVSNIPRIYTAIAEWMACMVYISQCPGGLTGRRFYLLSGAALLLQSLWLVVTGPLRLAFWIPCMAVAVGLMFLLIQLSCDMPLPSICYYTIRAFLLAEFAASLEWQLSVYATYDLALDSSIATPLILFAVYAAVFYVFYRLERRWKDHPFVLSLRCADLWNPLLIGLISFSMSNLSYTDLRTPFSSGTVFEIFNIRTLMDFSGVALLYAYHAQSGKMLLKRELDAIQNILHSQYAQYKQSRDSIDLINRKYHDLKHQIAVLRSEQDSNRRTAFLDEMEQEIKVYEAQNKTGNSVLDTLLTGKSLYCSKHQIELVCVADGAQLDFMSAMDLCTIFGNALDNAIEYELTIPEKKKRIVRIEVFAKNSFLIIRVENYFEGTLQLTNGLPDTTKAERDYHGFGLKSIRYTVEKYGGSMNVDAAGNWFRLHILLPLAN